MRERFLKAREWRVLLDSVPGLIALAHRDPQAHGLTSLAEEIWGYLGELAEQWHQGVPFVWYNLGFSAELVQGFDGVGRICPPMQAALHSIAGDPDITHELIDEAEASGVPPDSCSADKAGIGAIMRGLYPAPACVVGINTPCDSQVMATQALAELSRRPIFLIDVPYQDDERTVRHVADQLAELVPFLERHLGQPMDWDRLRGVCERSNTAAENILEWLDWRRAVPLTHSSKMVAFTLVHQVLFAGTQRGVRLTGSLAKEARERHERGEHYFEERVRAIWYQDPVWTDVQIYDWMERELGLTIPVDVFGYYANEPNIDTRTPESMLEGMARKLIRCQPMAHQFRGSIETYIADFMHMHEAFGADCGIFAGHVACKHAWGGIGLFKEACRKAGIPLLVFEFDMFDSRITPREGIETELTRFINEVVWPGKQRKLARAGARP